MAHSPLVRLLKQAARTVHGARRSEIPLLEYAESQRAALDRRRFLQLSGAAAGVALLGSCAATRGPSKQRSNASGARVIVVGAGIAGLHCAYRLQALGARADVFEGSARSGGRVLSDRKSFGAQSCELGGELIDTGHETMQDLAREFGLELYDFTQDAPELDSYVVYVDGRRWTEQEVLEAYAPIAAHVDQALAQLGNVDDGVTYDNPNGGAALDAMSIRQWLESIDAPPSFRKFLEVAYLTEYGLETDQSSALNLLLMISTELENFEVFGESDERFRIKSGNDAVTNALRERLTPGSLHLGARLVALHPAADGRIVATFQRDGSTFEETAEHVVSAIPFNMLRDVEIGLELSDVKRRAIRELDLGMNAKLMSGFRSRPWRMARSNGEVFTDLPFQCSWETSRLQPGDAGIITNFCGGAHAVAIGHGTPEEQAQAFLAGYDQVFPGARAAFSGKAVRMHWPTYTWTKGAYASYKVGQYTGFAGAEIERAGNLHFCGEHTSLDAQGFMEGGALTGAMAASEIAADLGLETAHRVERSERRILARAALARASGSWVGALRRSRRERGLVAMRNV